MSIPFKERELFRDATRADPEKVSRLVAGYKDRLTGGGLAPVRSRHDRSFSIAFVAVASIAVLAVVFVDVGRGGRTRALSASYDAALPTQVDPTPVVHLDYVGGGTLSGTEPAPVLSWNAGRVAVQVEPDRGVDFVLVTDEARVSVHGTSFEVARDALGTHVAVSEGRVEVACGQAMGTFLGAGERKDCLPRRPGGLLARARALQAAGQTESALEALDLGLSLGPPGDAARGELLALRALVYEQTGQRDAAMKDARSYLAEGHAPRADVMGQLIEKLGNGK
jgi:hypothetical protein